MKRPLIVLPAVVVLAAAVAGVSGAFSGGTATRHAAMAMPAPAAGTSRATTAKATYELHRAVVRLKIVNFGFKPAHLVVSPGTRVVWTNEDQDPHTVTSDQPGFSSQALDTGGAYTMVAKRAGTFTYHCTIHPFMHGTLVVKG